MSVVLLFFTLAFCITLYCAENISLIIADDQYYLDKIESLRENYDENHEALIYRLCAHRSRFTEQEIETARVYIQNRFINGASVKPQKDACKSIKVIRDFKCLSHEERVEFLDTFKQLYANGVIDRISYYHGGYWPFVHLLAEGPAFHNRFLLDLQHEIEKINPSVIMPYWDTTLDFGAPEKSIIWSYFGHAGNSTNNYCVADGAFKNQTVKYPTPHCLKREWSSDGTIPAWESPELLTYILQQSVGSLSVFSPMFHSQHFKKHLNYGGYNGDMSIVYATNEPLFHLFHIYEQYINFFKWQLQTDGTLVDLTFNSWGRHQPRYDSSGTKVVVADIETDTLLSYNSTTMAEAFSFGFGQFCYIPDQIIESVNNIVMNRTVKLPAAVHRLRNALPSDVFAQYFPKFATNTATEFNYLLPDVGSSDTVTENRCNPLPVSPHFNSTANGKRQFDAFNQIGVDNRNITILGETQIANFINTLN